MHLNVEIQRIRDLQKCTMSTENGRIDTEKMQNRLMETDFSN